MESFVFYQGEIVDEREINVGIRCKALNYGLGCFEGVRAYYDSSTEQLFAFKLEEHFKRFLTSCKILNIKCPYSIKELSNATVDVLKANNYKCNVYIRPMAFKGSNSVAPSLIDDDDRIVIYCQPMDSYASKEALSVCVASWHRLHDNALPARAKITGSYVNSALANMEAIQNGYDEAIFLTGEGYVAEGSSENIFLVRDGKLLTPAASESLLEGITRKLVIELAKNELNIEVIERRISRTELYSADEVFFSGTAMEVTPVIEVDRRIVGDGEPGPVYQKIKEIFGELTIGRMERYASSCTPVY